MSCAERRDEVLLARSCGRTKLQDDVNAKLWPAGIHRGPKAVFWKASEVAAMVAAEAAGASADQLRALAARLEAERRLVAAPLLGLVSAHAVTS